MSKFIIVIIVLDIIVFYYAVFFVCNIFKYGFYLYILILLEGVIFLFYIYEI